MKSFVLMLIAIVIISIVTIPLIVLNVIRKVYRSENLRDYFFTIAIGFDQAGGSILYGQEDWTVSSWTYRLSAKGNRNAYYFMRVIDFIFDHEHCKNSFIKEVEQMNSNARGL
jgi:hypothetical protein